MTETVLILGGTREAAALAAELVATRPDCRIITSLAGRTREPEPVAGEIRIGGFGGIEGLATYLSAERVTRVIDATHPFATRISANAAGACAIAGVPLETRIRPPWPQEAGDQWITVPDAEAARDAIPSEARVLLALGSQHIAPFATRTDVHFIIRMVDPPAAPLPFQSMTLVLGKPSSDWRHEAQLLTEHAVTHIVCRNSGGTGAYAKIEAARHLGLPVIMIGRH